MRVQPDVAKGNKKIRFDIDGLYTTVYMKTGKDFVVVTMPNKDVVQAIKEAKTVEEVKDTGHGTMALDGKIFFRGSFVEDTPKPKAKKKGRK